MTLPLHTVFLSLGSNMNHPFENLQEGIQLLFERIGSIQRISAVYQSPALGFEGDDFLNCVVQLSTALEAKEVMQHIMEIEKKMGRVRNPDKGYTSRPIDIDILFYDDAIINSESLQVPHPELQNRKFVLLPLAELAPRYIHPVSGKPVLKLLSQTQDKSSLEKLSKWLKHPGIARDLSSYNYIVVEGNIGAGKTTLAEMIARDIDAKLILERFQENPFLPKFYEDPKRFAFPLEMSFLADRYQQLLDDLKQLDLFKECVVADYDVYKSLIFSKITLQDEEFEVYKKLFHLMHRDLASPDLYIYLHQHPERLLQNIRERGRPFEQGMEKAYLERIHEGYVQYMHSRKQMNIRVIDISNIDFVKERKDYLSILDQLR